MLVMTEMGELERSSIQRCFSWQRVDFKADTLNVWTAAATKSHLLDGLHYNSYI